MHERILELVKLLRNSVEVTFIIPEIIFKMNGEKYEKMRNSYNKLKKDPELEILETSYDENLEITIKMKESRK